jgi:hypothetical protein
MVRQQSNVIGPITRADWSTLLYLRESVKWMRENNAVKFTRAINKESRLYQELIGKYKCAA